MVIAMCKIIRLSVYAFQATQGFEAVAKPAGWDQRAAGVIQESIQIKSLKKNIKKDTKNAS